MLEVSVQSCLTHFMDDFIINLQLLSLGGTFVKFFILLNGFLIHTVVDITHLQLT